MLRKLYLVPLLALLALPALAHAQFEAGNWEATIAGTGANDNEWRSFDISLQGSLGYFLTKEMEVSIREALNYGDGGSAWALSSFAAFDYHFDMDRWQPFVGLNIGKACGSGGSASISTDWFAGPELGVKYFVNSTTFIAVTAAYEFDLEGRFDDGAFQYSLALGFKW